MDFGARSLKSQMKQANRLGAKYTLIVGDNEIKAGAAILRDMATKAQVSIPIESAVANIKLKLMNS